MARTAPPAATPGRPPCARPATAGAAGSQCVEATMPKVPVSSGRVVNTLATLLDGADLQPDALVALAFRLGTGDRHGTDLGGAENVGAAVGLLVETDDVDHAQRVDLAW